MAKKTQNDNYTFEEKFNDYGEYDKIEENNYNYDYSINSVEAAPNYEEERKDEDPDRSDFIKKLIIGLGIIILIIIIILLLLRSCTNSNNNENQKINLEDTLLQAAKSYYKDLDGELPTTKATCGKVTSNVLQTLEYIGSDFDECDKENTYVKVCLLESGKYQYIPVLSCESTKTNFEDFKDGNETNLIEDKTDVEFLFKASYIDSASAKYGKVEELWKDEITYKNYKTLATTNYYRYRDKEYKWILQKRYYYPNDVTTSSDVTTYYVDYPANNYINKTGQTTAYRYYTLTNKVYAPNGYDGYATTAPAGYPYYDENESIAYVYYKTREWVEQGKPNKIAPTKMYICTNPNVPGNEFYSYDECSTNANVKYNEGYTVTKKVIYTCDAGVTTTSQSSSCYSCLKGSLNSTSTSCGYYTEFGKATSTPCDTKKKDICQTETYVMKRWYKATITYYGNTSPTGQVPYYKKAPVAGAIKDESTGKTVYKWYKLVESGSTQTYSAVAPTEDAVKTADYQWGNWSKYSKTAPEKIKGSREIETKVKVKLQQLLDNGSSSKIEISSEYLTEDELIKKLQAKGFKVYTLSDVYLNGEINLDIKLRYRNRI